MKRVDINRISAEKQQMILDYMRDAGKPLSVKEIFEALPLSRNDIRNKFGNLKVKKAIENRLDGTGGKSKERDESRGCLLLHTRRW